MNNHIPVKLIKKVNLDYCKRNFPLNINDQFCFIYQNQVLFNKGLKTFIKSMKKEDFLIYYSDTPPIFPGKIEFILRIILMYTLLKKIKFFNHTNHIFNYIFYILFIILWVIILRKIINFN